jgi:hypothetical protein
MGRVMKHLTLFLLTLALGSFTLAEFEIPNQFEDGQVTSASQMNENFQALKSEIEILKTQIEENQGSQIAFVGVTEEKFNGSAGHIEMNKACYRMISGSRFCRYYEFINSVKPEYVAIKEAWLLDTAENNGENCKHFSMTGSYQSWGINDTGHITNSMPCNSQIGVACCK